MPGIADVMNNQARVLGPSFRDQREDRNLDMVQGYAGVANSMAGTEMQRMKNDTMREKSSVLKNFEGRTDTPEFRDKMNTIDPDLVMKLQEKAASMDKAEREKMKEYFDKTAARVEMAKTREAWQQEGFNVPFEQRDRILGAALTYQQAFERTKEDNNMAGGGSGGGGKDWTMKAADSNSIKSSISSLYKGVYGPNGGFNFSNKEKGVEAAKITKRASTLYRQGRGQLSHNEAAYQAMEEAYGPPKTGNAGGQGSSKDPLGLR
jgi:hypothetical protein